MTNSQWPMTGDRGAACQPRSPDRTMPLRFLPLSRGRPVMTLVIGHWAFIGDWALGIGHSLVIGHWALVIAYWSCTILCQRPCRPLESVEAALAIRPKAPHAYAAIFPACGWMVVFTPSTKHMSTSPEADFDLEKLFLPAWAKESPQHNRYAKYEGAPERERRDDRRRDGRDRPPRRPDYPGARGPSGPKGPDRGGGPRPPRPAGGKGRDRRQDAGRQGPAPLPAVQIAFTPEEHGVDFLAKQIRMTGRAYPLFEIAQLILQKPERHAVPCSLRKKPDGTTIQPLFLCAMDDTLWLSENEAVRYVLDRHFSTFYQAERTQIDPPKGVYTFVAQCGMSGVILGPPNYHDYQNQLRKLHAERFARMPFEMFKNRVKIVRDEEVVKKWIEEQSWKTEYLCLNMPEPVKLPNMEAVEKHFRETHKENIVKQVEMHTLSGTAARNIRSSELARLVRTIWEDQRKFPLQIATALSQQFASRGLQFFKVNRTVTHVSVARPHYLDMQATPVSEGVKRIVDFINATPKCTRRQLLAALAPAPPQPTVIPVQAEAPLV